MTGFVGQKIVWVICVALLSLRLGAAHAFPVFEAVPGLPSQEFLTVYPDDADAQLFYLVPTSFALARDDKGKPRLGVQYWGLTGVDPESAGASFRFSIQPSFDRPSFDRLVAALRKRNPKAVYVFPPLAGSSLDVLLNGAPMPGSQDTSSPTSATGGKLSTVGGTLDSTETFTIAVANVGARVFAAPARAAENAITARYRYRVLGIGKRLHAEVTLHPRRIYDYFKADEARLPWRPTVGDTWSADWQTLIRQGDVSIRVLDSGDADTGAYMAEVLNSLLAENIASETLFAPQVRPDGRAEMPEAASFGWVFGESRAWAALAPDVTQTYTIDTKKLEEREMNAGLALSAACGKYPERFSDLTLIGHKCIDDARFTEVARTTKACLDAKLADLYTKNHAGLIPSAVFDALAASAYDSPCMVAEDGRMAAMLANIHTSDGTMSAPAFRDATDRCRDTRLADVKKHYLSGDISLEQWERQVPLVFQVPCRNNVKTAALR